MEFMKPKYHIELNNLKKKTESHQWSNINLPQISETAENFQQVTKCEFQNKLKHIIMSTETTLLRM